MFERVRRVRTLARFVEERGPSYGLALSEDLHRFRLEIVKAAVGAAMAAAAGLMFACFLSVALLVSAWDGSHRVLVAWMLAVSWALPALAGLWYARRAIVGQLPFRLTAAAISRDYELLSRTMSGAGAFGKNT
jgi:uncharacterized membrane protein YqjE